MKKNIENNQEQNTEQEVGIKEVKSGLQDQYRVVINKEAQLALMALVERVNSGFEGGEITKSDIVNWMLVHSMRFVTDADVKALRSLYFDEKKMLGSLLRNAGEQGALPDEIKKVLRDYYNITEGSKKRTTPQSAPAG
ncbi:hypothetical protein WDW86_17805 [Bdellovibrionota bacterium FG-2]